MHIRKNMIDGNEGFTCKKCGQQVGPHEAGSCRNHCPHCLFSLHVDESVPGDRASTCGALMAPVGVEMNKKKGPRIEHRCRQCGKNGFNRVAPDDNWDLICQISRIPREA